MEHLRRVIKTMIDSQDADDVFMTFGCDFSFTQAEVNYGFLDQVVTEWNKRFPDVELIYSNPRKYLDTVKQRNEEFTVKAKNERSNSLS